ncbi:uncharacterized protein LOC144548453 isoform X3 [Carex rostrata]
MYFGYVLLNIEAGKKALDVLGLTCYSVGGKECGRMSEKQPHDEIKSSFTDLLMDDSSTIWPLPFYPLQNTAFSQMDIINNKYVYKSSRNTMKDWNE